MFPGQNLFRIFSTCAYNAFCQLLLLLLPEQWVTIMSFAEAFVIKNLENSIILVYTKVLLRNYV